METSASNINPPQSRAIKTELAVGRTVGLLCFSPSFRPRNSAQICEQLTQHIDDLVGNIANSYNLSEQRITDAAVKMIRALQTDRTIGFVQYNSTLAGLSAKQSAVVSHSVRLMQSSNKIKNLPDFNRFKASFNMAE